MFCVGTGTAGRWTWLAAESCLQRRGSEAGRSAPRAPRERLRKRLVHNQKQQLVNLETATKSLGEVGSGVMAVCVCSVRLSRITHRRGAVHSLTSLSTAGAWSAQRRDLPQAGHHPALHSEAVLAQRIHLIRGCRRPQG